MTVTGLDPTSRPGARHRRATGEVFGFLLMYVVVLSVGSAAGQVSPTVSIAGGADESGQHYTWTLTNEYSSPITHVEFPHYMGDLFTVPEGWTAELTEPLGKTGRSGRLIAEASAASRGIAQGRSLEFGLKIGPAGTPRGEGDVVVRFADGTEILVRAEVPVREALGNRYMSLIGLGLIFGVFLLIRVWKAKRRNPSLSADEA